MDIVILGDPEYIALEWKLLKNFSKIYFVSGSILSRCCLVLLNLTTHRTSRGKLRDLNINRCRRCILLSSKAGSREEPVL